MAERRSETISEILRAAWEVARIEGIGGLTLRDVAREVGMRPPSLYSYFESKDDLYDAMFAQGCRQFLEARRAVTLSGETLADLKLAIRFFVQFCTEDTVRYQLLFQRVVPGFQPSDASYALAKEALAELTKLLERSGVVDPRAVDLLTAVSVGLVDQQISNDPGGERWVRLVDESVEMFYSHITKETGADG